MSWHAFWFERSMEASRLALLRLVFFGLLGFDLLVLMVPHAWRYGAGELDVPHFDWLVLPVDSTLQAALYVFSAFLAFRIALGMAARSSLVLLTFTYSAAYFSSLHDGYQHHYLICWLLLISWAVPFHRAPGVDAGRVEGRLTGWGLSLLYAQIAIVYLFTAITKVDTWWLNGWALERQISRPWVAELLDSVQLFDAYAVVACIVCLWQFSVAASFLLPRLRKWACVTGPLFHAMVEVIDLDIGWFSFYMIGLYYLLLFPDDWYAKFSARWKGWTMPHPGPRWLVGAGALAVGTIMTWGSVLPGGLAVGVAAAGATLFGGRGSTRAALHIALALLVVSVPRWSGSAYDHYRFLGGDLKRRGHPEEAVEPYRLAIELKPGPDSRHFVLGRLLLDLDRPDEAAEVLAAGQRAEPYDLRYVDALLEAWDLPECD